MGKDLEKLAQALRGLKKPSIDFKAKERIKSDILLQIKQFKEHPDFQKEIGFLPYSLNKLREVINKLAQIVVPSAESKARMKEKVLTVVEQTSSRHAFQWNFSHIMQKVVAVFLVAVIALTSFTVYMSDIPVTKAFPKTAFQEVKGLVEVVRRDQRMEAYKNMVLEQGDLIITGSNGIAVIRYVDDSITRLSPKTELKIQKLYHDEKNRAKTEVEVKLSYGRIWSQVVNLVGKDSSFKVKTDDITATTNNKASFDISSDTNNENIKLNVFDNKVEISVKENNKEKKKLLLEGYSIEVDKKEPQSKKVVINKNEKDDNETWVTINKTKDKQYKEDIKKETTEERKKEAGVLPKDPLYTAKKLNETTKLLVTTNDNEKVKLKVDIAKKRLLEASTLLDDEDSESAEKVLQEFNTIITEISIVVKESDELTDYAKNIFNEQTKDLSVILPDSPLYPVKEALRNAKKELAITQNDKKEAELAEVTEKIMEAKELVNDDKGEIAVETLVEIHEDFTDTEGETVIEEKSEESDESVDKVIDAHVDSLSSAKVLKEAVEEDTEASRELHNLVEEAEDVLEDELEEVISDPEITLSDESLEKADAVLEDSRYEQTSPLLIIDEILLDSDSAVIMPIMQVEPVLVQP